ncbi:MAG: transporter related protein [Proteobacteria bacterium]|nr:transporter related protein [Pseudomonadota bacterium]
MKDKPKLGSVFLETRGIHKRFGGVHALRGVSITIRCGEIYHLLGENGCGKSTLIKIISGAQPPDEGCLVIDGNSYQALTPIESLALGVETVYQDLSLIPNLTVAENVALSEQLVRASGRLAKVLDRAALRETSRRALSAVNLAVTDDFLDTVVSNLPLAVRQLIAIARAIATKARLVIMDEPTTSLTRMEVENLVRVVNELRKDGVAVLFVTHKLDECYAIGGQVIIFRDGQCVAQDDIQALSKIDLSRLMTGKHLDGGRYRKAQPAEQVLLDVRKLGCESYFSDVTFQLKVGEILGITGLMDSGRNELAMTLAGVIAASGGTMTLGGEQVVMESPADAIRYRIGYVPEDRLGEGLFLDKPIRDNIISAILDRLLGAFGMLDRAKSTTLANDIVSQLQIATPGVDLPVQSLSGGNQQRVLIGRWLTIAPRLLVLHGPTVGVDVGSKDTIYRSIQDLAQQGLGVIIISDDLPEILQNCDRVLVMRRGKIRADVLPEIVAEDQLYQAMIADETKECQ